VNNAPAQPTAAPTRAPLPHANTVATLAAIDSVGFHSRPTTGYGGFIALDLLPVVLLRSGELLKDVSALRFPGGLAARLLTEKGWAPLAFPKTHASLPQGLVLDGVFRDAGGTGNLAAGGSDAVTVWDEYRFNTDCRVDCSGGASSSAPQRQGRYRINGLTLDITYVDGSGEQRILITDPGEFGEIGNVIWNDGAGDVRRKG